MRALCCIDRSEWWIIGHSLTRVGIELLGQGRQKGGQKTVVLSKTPVYTGFGGASWQHYFKSLLLSMSIFCRFYVTFTPNGLWGYNFSAMHRDSRHSTSCGALRSGWDRHAFLRCPHNQHHSHLLRHLQLAAKNFIQLPNFKKYIKSLQDPAFHENQIHVGRYTICNSEEISSKIRDRRHLGSSNCAAHHPPWPPIKCRGSKDLF